MRSMNAPELQAIHKRFVRRARLGSQLRESGVISGGASIEGGLEPAPAAGRSQLQAGEVRGTGCEVLEPSEPGPRAWKECAGGTRLTKSRPARRRRRNDLSRGYGRTAGRTPAGAPRARNSCTWNARPLVEVPGTGVDCWCGEDGDRGQRGRSLGNAARHVCCIKVSCPSRCGVCAKRKRPLTACLHTTVDRYGNYMQLEVHSPSAVTASTTGIAVTQSVVVELTAATAVALVRCARAARVYRAQRNRRRPIAPGSETSPRIEHSS